jgi:hypothetical protein
VNGVNPSAQTTETKNKDEEVQGSLSERKVNMVTARLEARLTALEAEVARLKLLVEQSAGPRTTWTDKILGAFANDPAFEEAMRLGREDRESLRPKPRNRRKK